MPPDMSTLIKVGDIVRHRSYHQHPTIEVVYVAAYQFVGKINGELVVRRIVDYTIVSRDAITYVTTYPNRANNIGASYRTVEAARAGAYQPVEIVKLNLTKKTAEWL